MKHCSIVIRSRYASGTRTSVSGAIPKPTRVSRAAVVKFPFATAAAFTACTGSSGESMSGIANVQIAERAASDREGHPPLATST